MRSLVCLLLLPIILLGLAGCPAAPVRPEYPPIRFADKPPIALDVARIRIEVRYEEPLTPPHVGQEFPVPPLAAARRWAEDRLRAVGRSGTATVTILEAGATETDLERSTGLKGLIRREQSQRYEVTVSMSIAAAAAHHTSPATAEAVARRTVTVLEDADLNQREAAWYKLTKDTMTDFDRAMELEIRKTLRDFVK